MEIAKLIGHLPDHIYNQISSIVSIGIDGPKRLSHLLGNCKHETGNWTVFEENLNYSEQGLLKTFPEYFDAQQAKDYARQPEKIANHVYANRMGNGDEQSGDGWKHRGMGALQITGKNNQEEFFITVGLPKDSDPHLLATKYQIVSGGYFFKKNKLWTICDQGVGEAICTLICRRVNGGINGLADRVKYTQEFYNILTI